MLPCDKAKFKADLSFRSFVSKIFALCMDLSMCCFCVILEPTFGVLIGEIIYNNDIFDHCKNSGSPGAELSVVIISPFSIPPSPDTHKLTQTHTHTHTHTQTASTNHSRPAPSHAPERGFKSNFSWKIRCFSSIFEPFVQGLVLFT